jgi:hypothetical protein
MKASTSENWRSGQNEQVTLLPSLQGQHRLLTFSVFHPPADVETQQLLRETTRPIIEIGMDGGYTSPSHFAHVFRKKTGDQSPRVSGENAGRRARGKFSRIATG